MCLSSPEQIFEAAKAPFMMQNTGGAITRAMNAHMSSV